MPDPHKPQAPLEVELLLSEAQRVSIDEHAAFLESLKTEPEEEDL